MATYQDSTSMSTNRLTLLLVGHSFVHFRAVCNSKCAGNTNIACSWTLQTLLHCCENTNIAVLLYLLVLTNIAALLWNYKYCCTCNTCYSIYLQDLTNIVTLCLPGFMNIYTIYLHEQQYGLLNIIFHEIMTAAARLGCYNKLS